jgi:hypothetical protein
VVLSLLACGCQATRAIDESQLLSPGTFGVMVVVGADGSTQTSQPIHVGAGAVPVALSSGERIYLFTMSVDDFVSPDGSALPDAMIAGVQTHIAGVTTPPTGTGECGRCMVTSSVAKALVFPGDSCEVPAFAQPHLLVGPSGLDPNTLRRSVAIDWPGTCPCPAAPPAPRGRNTDLQVIVPSVDATPAATLVGSPDGFAAGFGLGLAFRVDPAGMRTDVVTGSAAAPLFDGTLEGCLGFDGGRFLAASAEVDPRTGLQYSKLQSFGPGAFQAPTPFPQNLPIEILHLDHLDPRAPDLFLITGKTHGMGTLPSVSLCGFSSGACDDLNLPVTGFDGLQASPQDAHGVMLTSSGRLVVLDLLGAVWIGDPPSGSCGSTCLKDPSGRAWEFRGSTRLYVAAARALGPDTGAYVTTHPEIGRVGDRAFVCTLVQSVLGGGDKYLVTLTSTLTGSDPAWVPVKEAQKVGYSSNPCGGFVRRPHQPTQLLQIGTPADDGAMILDGETGSGTPIYNAQVMAEYGVPDSAFTAFQDLTSTSAPALVLSLQGNAWLAPDRSPPHLIYGSPTPRPQLDRVVGAGGAFWAFSPRSTPPLQIFEPSGQGARASTPAGVQSDPMRVVLAAAEDHRAGGVLVSSAICGPAGSSFLNRLVRAGDRVVTTTISLIDRVSGIAELSPGRFLLIADGPRLFELDGDALTEIRIDWDDPETPQIEIVPTVNNGNCPISDAPSCPSPRAVDVFRAVDAVDGVAFVVGCGGTLLRVAAGRAERISVTRGSETQWQPATNAEEPIDPPALSAVRALCPDQALFGAMPSFQVRSTDATEIGWFFDTTPSGGSLKVEDYSTYQLGPRLRFGIGYPIAILGPVDAPVAIFQGGVLGTLYAFGNTKERPQFNDTFGVAGALPSGQMLIGTGEDRLLLATPR